MMSDNKIHEVRVTNTPIATTWVMGWLFSVGYLGGFIESASAWEAIGQLLVMYFAWPILLGMRLAGGG